jgi:hypothetical protein
MNKKIIILIGIMFLISGVIAYDSFLSVSMTKDEETKYKAITETSPLIQEVTKTTTDYKFITEIPKLFSKKGELIKVDKNLNMFSFSYTDEKQKQNKQIIRVSYE